MKVTATKNGVVREFSSNAWRLMPAGKYGWIEIDLSNHSFTKPQMPEELIVNSFPEFNVPPVVAPVPPPVVVKKNDPVAAKAAAPKKRRRTKK